MRQQNFTWTAVAHTTPYISAINTGLNVGLVGVETWTLREMLLDAHGNLLWSKVYNYAPAGQTGALLRTYTNSYLATEPYTSRYIYNRLLSSTVAGGASNVTLVQNVYDNYYPFPLTDLTNPAPRQHDASYNHCCPRQAQI